MLDTLEESCQPLAAFVLVTGCRIGEAMLFRAGVKINVVRAGLGHSRWQTTADWCIENHVEGVRAALDVATKLLAGKGT